MGKAVYDPLAQSVCSVKFIELFLDFPEILEVLK